MVLPGLLVAETSLLALFCHQTGHCPRRVSRAPDLRLADACTGSGALSTPAGCSHRRGLLVSDCICQASALQLAAWTLAGVFHICSLNA